MTKIAKRMAAIIGIFYVLLAALAWLLPNPVIGSQGILRTNSEHDLAHAILGAILIACSLSGETASSMGLYFVAMLSLAFAVLGLMVLNGAGIGRIGEVVLVNAAANWFHAAMAVVC